MYSNDSNFGGDMLKVVEEKMSKCKNVTIASGYTSYDILNKFKPEIIRIAKSGGLFRFLLGMAFYEGVSGKTLKILEEIHAELAKAKNGSGIYVIYSRKFHGKIYSFKNGGSSYYVGSSNFSNSGLAGNLECTTHIKDKPTQNKIEDYLTYLFDPDNAKPIVEAEITVHGSKAYKERLQLHSLGDLAKFDPKTIDKSKLKYFELSLDRIADKPKSNLNAYFGKGRWSRSTGKVRTRPWYEVELIADRSINSNVLYPKGEFTGYTDDGFVMPMKTSGDYSKNIRSKGKLTLLGEWIKGKLQESGALIPLQPITRDTLEAYGCNSIKFYKIKKGEYYMEFVAKNK